MNKIIKKLIASFVVILSVLLVTNLVNGKEYANDTITVDDGLNYVWHHEEDYTMKYAKRYWTAKNKGDYEFSKVSLFNGVFKKYDRSNNTYYLALVSALDIAYYYPGSDNYININNQYYIKEFTQGFYVTGTHSDKFIYGSYSPNTKKSCHISNSGFSISLKGNTNSQAEFGISYSYSDSSTIEDIECVISKYNQNGRKWDFKATRESTETRSEVSSVVTQVICLKNATEYNGQDITVNFDNYIKWHLPVYGWEEYDPYTGDKLNSSLNQSKTFKIEL